MKRIWRMTAALILFLLIIIAVLVSTQQKAGEEVSVLYAGSLISLMETSIGPAFMRETGFRYLGEGHGSIQNAYMLIDGQRFPDVFISAGTEAMEILMKNERPLVSWYITFAADEIVIAYNEKSPAAGLLEKAARNELSWYEVLSRPDIRFLRTDPELDPKGYYTVIMARLADIFYGTPSISSSILRGERNLDFIRPEEVLMTLLESGEADAVSAYMHEAIERGLPFIRLPPEISLGYPEFADFYKKANYTTESGKIIVGKPIVFTVTIPETANNVEGALAFIKFLLSDEAGKIMEKHGFRRIRPQIHGEAPQEIINLLKRVNHE